MPDPVDAPGSSPSTTPRGLVGWLRGRSSAGVGSIWSGVGMAGSAAATLVANLFVVWSAAPAVFADLTVITIGVTIIAGVFRFGTERVFVPEVQSAFVLEGQEGGRQRGADLLALAGLLAVLGGLLVAVGPLRPLLTFSLSEPFTTTEAVLVGLWVMADVFRLVGCEADRTLGRFVLTLLGGVGLRAPLFLAIVVAERVWLGTPTRLELLAAASAASMVALATGLPSVLRSFPLWRANPVRGLITSWHGNSMMLAANLTASLIGGADIWIVGATSGADDRSRYAFAVSTVAGIAMLTTAINGGLAPTLAASAAKGDRAAVISQSVRFVRIATVLAGLLLVGLVALGEPLAVFLGGESYRGVMPFLAILGAGQVMATMCGISGYVLMAFRRYSLVTLVTVITAAVVILLEVVAGFGARSAILVAVVSGLGTGVLSLANNVIAARRVGVRTDILARPGANSRPASPAGGSIGHDEVRGT